MIVLFLLLNFAHAENWMRVDDIKAGLLRGYELKESCEKGTLDELMDVVIPCPTINEPDAICTIKVPKKIKNIPCPTVLNPNDICPINVACVEIGNITPNVVGVNESVIPHVAIIDPVKKAAKDAEDAAKLEKNNNLDKVSGDLKALPNNIPDNQLSDAINNILKLMGIK